VILADRLSFLFDSAVRFRGAGYFRQRHVRLEPSDGPPEDIRAVVRGSRTYRVRLVVAEVAGLSCSCEYFADVGPCKHLWATVLEADLQGVALKFARDFPVRGMRDLADATAPEDDDDDDGGFDSDDAFPAALRRPAAPPRSGPARAPAKPVPPKPPAWETLLNSVSAAQAEPEPTVRPYTSASAVVFYVLEGPASRNRGRTVIGLFRRSRLASGAWGTLKPFIANRWDLVRSVADPHDRTILELLLAGDATNPWSYSGYGQTPALAPTMNGTLLPMLLATGRFLFRPLEGFEPVPLRRDEGPAWRFRLRLEPADARGGSRLVGRLVRGDETFDLADADLLSAGRPGLLVRPQSGAAPRPGGPDPRPRLLCDFDDAGGWGWIPQLRSGRKVVVPPSDRERFLNRLADLPALPELEWPDGGPVIEDAGPPRGELAVTRPAGGNVRLTAELAFRYFDRRVEPTRPGDLVLDPAAGRQMRRDRAAEARLQARLDELGLVPTSTPGSYALPSRRLPEIAAALTSEGWSVLAGKQPVRAAGDFRLEVSTGIDWFDVTGKLSFSGGIDLDLADLLSALKRGDSMVMLGDGTLGVLPEDWLDRNGLLLDLGRRKDGAVRYSAAQIGLLDAMLADRPGVSFDRAFSEARDRLKRFSGIAEAEAAEGFVGQLRPYQKLGLGWLKFLDEFGFGGCLADDMGLGKTVQVLAFLAGRKAAAGAEGAARPSLVVVPKSLIFNWMAEASRFAPGLRVLNLTGLSRRDEFESLDGWDLVLTTYGTLRQDVKILADREFDFCILDEAQAIKNADSQTAKAVRLINARRRLGMSGTPIENHLGELWSLFEFLNPGMLGDRDAFRVRFASVASAGAKAGDSAQRRAAAEEAMETLRRAVRPFLLRRTKEQVAPELPAKTEETLICDMPAEQRLLYDGLRNHYRASVLAAVKDKGLNKSKIVVLEALLRLRQAACHPGLLDAGRRAADSAKFEVLVPRLAEAAAEGHKVLVFSQFVKLLDLLRPLLEKEKLVFEYLDGRTRDRQARVERFQTDPDCKLFLISLKAGGTGLNLTAADYVFVLDPWWNPAVEAQAVDRAHRIGQDKKVFAYRMICRDSIEEKVAELQGRKKDLADAVITADSSLLRTLTAEDLEMLLA
jgi:superfamily II DNA or RNA helicase